MPLGIQRNKSLHHRRPQNQAIYFRTINLKKNWVWLPVFCWITYRSSPMTPQMSLLTRAQLQGPQWGAKVSCPQAWGSSTWEQLKAENPLLVPQHPLLVQVELPLPTELVILGLLLSQGVTDAETPKLWPPNAKSQLIWKDPNAEKDWRPKERRTAEDEMVR